MNYRYQSTSDRMFEIVESATNHIIVTGVEYYEAKHTAKRLNSGGGFNGWTPEFMLQRLEPSGFIE